MTMEHDYPKMTKCTYPLELLVLWRQNGFVQWQFDVQLNMISIYEQRSLHGRLTNFALWGLKPILYNQQHSDDRMPINDLFTKGALEYF